MTSLTMLVSLFVFVAVTAFAYNRYESSMTTAVLLGFVGAILTGGSMQPGFFAEADTFSVLGIAVLLAPVVTLELGRSEGFAAGNAVLLSRESHAGLNMRNAIPLNMAQGSAVCHAA